MKKRFLHVAVALLAGVFTTAALAQDPILKSQNQLLSQRAIQYVPAEGETPQPEQQLPTEGQWQNITWKVTENNTLLTFTGTGKMPDIYTNQDIPQDIFAHYKTVTKVVVGEGITNVGQNALFGFTSLETVELPTTVTHIKDFAFYGDTKLTNINLSDDVQIGYGVFELNSPFIVANTESDGCVYTGKNLYAYVGDVTADFNLVVREGTKYIAEDLMAMWDENGQSTDNTFLKSVQFPSSLETIGFRSFLNCVSLTEVTIPASVTEIMEYAFQGCSKLATVNLLRATPPVIQPNTFFGIDQNCAFNIPQGSETAYNESQEWNKLISDVITGTLAEGITYDINKTAGTLTVSGTGAIPDMDYNKRPWFSLSEFIKTITVGDGITTIGKNAFNAMEHVTKVNLPASGLTKIGEGSFWGCRLLTEFTIPEGVIELGPGALGGAPDLATVTLPSTLDKVGNSAFEGTAYEASFPEGVVRIGNTAYKYVGDIANCPNLVIEEGIKYIAPKFMTRFNEEGYLVYNNTLKTIQFPESLLEIGWLAFSLSPNVHELVIPANVTKLENQAFCYFENLTRIEIQGSKPEITPYTFQDVNWAYLQAANIESYNYEGSPWLPLLGETKEGKINETTSFVYNKKEKSLAIQGTGATSDYNALSDRPWNQINDQITSLTVSEGITHLGINFMNEAYSLAAVTFPESLTSLGDGSFSNTKIFNDQVDKVVVLGNIAYTYNGDIHSVTDLQIPEGVKHINPFAFSDFDADNVSFNPVQSIKTVTLPESLLTIGDFAFTYLPNIEQIVLPSKLQSVGEDAFLFCDGLRTVEPKGLTPPTLRTRFSLPEMALAKVPAEAYDVYKADFLWSLAMREEISKGLGQYSWELHKITGRLTIKGSGVMPYDSYPWLDYNKRITSLTLGEGIIEISKKAFTKLEYLTEVSLPTTLQVIQDSAFCTCVRLTTINFPDGLHTIGASAFCNDIKLRNVTLPAKLDYVHYKAFEDTPFLNEQTDPYVYLGKTLYCCTAIPDEDTYTVLDGTLMINQEMFFYNTKLKTINLPASVQKIGDNAFSNCANLATFNVKAVYPPTTTGSAFAKISAAAILYVPEESIQRYQEDPVWGSAFTQIKPLAKEPDTPTSVETTQMQNTVLATDGQIILTAQGADYAVYNLSGQILRQGSVQGSVTLSDLPRGIYILRLGSQTHKLAL